MSEKKYYVALKCDLSHRMSREIDGIGHFFHSTSEEVKSSKFTKSELAEIMGGALYKHTVSLPFEWLYSFESLKEKLGWEFNETIDKWEYTNPIIELVPVEDKNG